MTLADIEELLAYAGRQTGICKLTLERIRETRNLTVIAPASGENSWSGDR